MIILFAVVAAMLIGVALGMSYSSYKLEEKIELKAYRKLSTSEVEQLQSLLKKLH